MNVTLFSMLALTVLAFGAATLVVTAVTVSIAAAPVYADDPCDPANAACNPCLSPNPPTWCF